MVLTFSCTGKGCHHSWISGRGATSSEQICKCCGESVVGVLSKGPVFCEVDKEAASANDAGEVVKIRVDRTVAPGWATLELEERLVDFVRSEVKFISQFFDEEGVVDYVAYRSGKSLRGDEGRDRKQDARLVVRMASVVEALCKAEFEGTMRGGEADAKLQALLDGSIEFTILSAPERQGSGCMVTAAVDFAIVLDVEEKIADKADERLQKLQRVMKEMDKKLMINSGADTKSASLMHPRQLLAQVISGLDWKRGLSNNSAREGHDRIRCMTCRFSGEDCSNDVARSQDVRHSLRRLPSFVFCARMVVRHSGGCKDWKSRASDLLEGIAYHS
eukprot:TRINITY_DN68608_c0_g1_i1.p1 TRINITY_DN68608_c0_g1~~TRINITY_DN68608_c0_g1_i1.p1  ORF type:complete len:389 (+),score=96.55 TRINITY_DN68608_c0_g1_i1:172-1167(+)